jgi:hypothetical protein
VVTVQAGGCEGEVFLSPPHQLEELALALGRLRLRVRGRILDDYGSRQGS